MYVPTACSMQESFQNLSDNVTIDVNINVSFNVNISVNINVKYPKKIWQFCRGIFQLGPLGIKFLESVIASHQSSCFLLSLLCFFFLSFLTSLRRVNGVLHDPKNRKKRNKQKISIWFLAGNMPQVVPQCFFVCPPHQGGVGAISPGPWHFEIYTYQQRRACVCVAGRIWAVRVCVFF